MSYLYGAARRMPLILCLLTPLSIFLTYGIAVAGGHVAAFWPYISDTGTTPPESCIFGLLLSTIAFLLCLVIYVRYREVSEYAKLCPSVGITPLWNRVAAFLGFISALGLHMVANFQESNEFTTHIVGAMMCFFSASLYFFMQVFYVIASILLSRRMKDQKTVFTRKMQPEAKLKFWIRTLLTFLSVLFIVGTFAPLGPAFQQYKGNNVLKWKKEDGGFSYHILSTVSEWLLVFCFCGYICTLFWDFRKIRIEPPRIQFLALEEGQREDGGESDRTDDVERGKGTTPWI